MGILAIMKKKKIHKQKTQARQINYLGHSFSLFAVRILYASLTVLTMLAFALIWGREEQGYFAMFHAAVLIGGMLFSLGLPNAILYSVARNEVRPGVARETSWGVPLFFFLVFGGIVFLSEVGDSVWTGDVAYFILGDSGLPLLLLLAACALVANLEGQLSVRLACGEAESYIRLQIIRSVSAFFLVSMALVAIPIPTPDYHGTRAWPLMAWSLGLLLTSLLAMVEGRSGRRVAVADIIAFLKHSLSYGLSTVIASVNILLLARLDHFLIYFFLHDTPDGDMHAAALVGIYALATQAAELPRLFSGTVASLLVPHTAAKRDSQQESITPLVVRITAMLMLAIIPFLAAAFWLALQLLASLGRDYSAAWPVFWVLIPGTLCLALDDVLSSHLLGHKKPHWNTRGSAVMLLLNIVLNFLWIPKYGIVGAAWATTLSYILGFIIAGYLVCRLSRIRWQHLLPRISDVPKIVSLFSSPPSADDKTRHTPNDSD
jgi:O-antigen/teichoic acid export membrane protein